MVFAKPNPVHRLVFRAPSDESADLAEDIKLEALELIEALTIWYSERGGHPPTEGATSSDEINEVFRPLHTLKGLCQMGGLSDLESLVHIVEDRVSLVREGKETFSQQVFDLLGDLLRVIEQYFQVYPDPIPESLAEAIKLLGETSTNMTSGASESSATVESFGTDETGLEGPLEDDFGASPSELSGTKARRDEDKDLSPTAEENRRFAEFCTRSENLLVTVYSGEAFSDRATLSDNDGYESLTRVVEIIYERTLAPHGTLIVFASDLDAEMAGSLGNVTVQDLERNDLALAMLDEPWSLVAFETSSNASGDGATDEGSENPSAHSGEAPPTEVATPQQTSAVPGAASAPPSPKAAASAPAPAASASSGGGLDLPYEDFDSTNQSANEAAMELDQEMLDDFLTNADELLEQLTQSMLDLEADPSNIESVESIFRAAHTIKGTAGMFGFRAIERLTHVMENTFDRIRKGELIARSALMDGLLVALDRVRGCFESLKKGQSAELTINEALNMVLQADFAAVNGINLETAVKSSAPVADAPKAAPVQGSSPATPPSGDSSPKPAAAGAAPEKSDKKKIGKKGGEVGTIRVDLGRLDALVNLVGELVIDRTRFAKIEENLRASGQNSELLHTMSETLLLFGRHMNDVQSIIMKIRMVPVGNAFYKFTRVVRDLARAVGKEIDLIIEGGETELDKTLVEEIGDPLVHIIRNSADHGIETPEERIAAGKDPRGTITLKAYQDGNMIVIFISDDGKGLAVDRIKTKAIANGLISEADQLSEKDIFNLIFEPGFSTADKVTNISGRGVGMDAVKKSITKLKGGIEIDSVLGTGTQITIKLPLTLAIIPSLLVESHGETYAIPLVNVIESIRISPDEVQRIGHSDFVKLRERVVPLLRLGDVFDLESLSERLWYSLSDEDVPVLGETPLGLVEDPELSPSATKGEALDDSALTTTLPLTRASGGGSKKRTKKPRLIFVVVGVGDQRVGFIVDQLMGQQEIVIKSLGSILGRTRGVSGGCVLGNGRVVLVLDVGELIEDHSDSSKGGGRVAV